MTEPKPIYSYTVEKCSDSKAVSSLDAALEKIGDITSKSIHLSPSEAEAVMEGWCELVKRIEELETENIALRNRVLEVETERVNVGVYAIVEI